MGGLKLPAKTNPNDGESQILVSTKFMFCLDTQKIQRNEGSMARPKGLYSGVRTKACADRETTKKPALGGL